MKFIGFIRKFIKEHFFNETWKCNACSKEIFSGEFLCEDCKKELSFLSDVSICNHCGRALKNSQEYCTTCKERLLSTTKGRSVFEYKGTASVLIKKFKYNGDKYLKEYFAEKLSSVYFKNYYLSDYITFVPSTIKSQKKRGYNQSFLLCEELSKRVGVKIFHGVSKVKETNRQAKLSRKQRKENLKGSFKVTDKKLIKDKVVTIIDDVTTTGVTIETLATAILKAGAKQVNYITVASVAPVCGY